MPGARPIVPVAVGDRVEMRKLHPCGSVEWQVTRVGMDIGLQCAGCRRRVMIARSQFERQLRRFVARAAADNQGVPDGHEEAGKSEDP